MPFYTKVNSNLRDSNIFVKPSGSEILKEAKNVWVKNTNNVLKPIWNYWWTLGNWEHVQHHVVEDTNKNSYMYQNK